MNTQDWHLSAPHGTEYTHSKSKTLGFLSLTSYFGRFLTLHTVYGAKDLHVALPKSRSIEVVLQFLGRARKGRTSQAQHNMKYIPGRYNTRAQCRTKSARARGASASFLEEPEKASSRSFSSTQRRAGAAAEPSSGLGVHGPMSRGAGSISRH